MDGSLMYQNKNVKVSQSSSMQEDKTREQACESVPILFNARGQDKGVNSALEIRPRDHTFTSGHSQQ